MPEPLRCSRLRGLEVTVFGRQRGSYRNSDLVEALGARYVSTEATPILDEAGASLPYDLIFEATGPLRSSSTASRRSVRTVSWCSRA